MVRLPCLFEREIARDRNEGVQRTVMPLDPIEHQLC
jgi:hypothetical protein